jgi:hypothetical protein
MTKFLLLATLTMVAVCSLPAAVVDCPTAATTLDVLLGFNSLTNACQSQDKLFWNFNYTPGSNAPSADRVIANLIFNQGGAVDIHGWNFGSLWSQNPGTGALADFTLGFTIEVCPAAQCGTGAGTVITNADATYAPTTLFPAGPETVTWSTGATATLTSGNSGPLPPGGDIGLGAGSTGPISVSAAFSGTGAMTQTSLRFYETVPTGIPEPTAASLFLGGAAMIALGCCRRKKGGHIV